MSKSILSSNRVRLPFLRNILVPVVLVALTTLSLGGFSILRAVNGSNDVSTERQLQTMLRSIKGIVHDLALQQETVAIWDDPVVRLRNDPPDAAWLDDNLGVWLYRTFGHDQVFILDARDNPLYAAAGGARADLSAYGDVRLALQGPLTELRDRAEPPAASATSPDSAYLTSGRAVYVAHFLNLRGRPAAVSAMRIVPHTDSLERRSPHEFVLVSVRFLGEAFLGQLSERNLIEGLRFSATDRPEAGEVSVPVQSDAGDLVGYFIWKPELPGDRALKSVGPATALAAAVIVLLLGLLVRRLYQSMVALERTVLELQASEAQAHHLAFHDVLTGLPNRAMFDDRLQHAITRMKGGETTAVMMLDLDRFKNINDTLGHHAGDSLIREFAARLSNLVRKTDTVARLGGDEFAIVMEAISGEEDATALCERILAAAQQSYDVLGHQVFVGASIGVVLAPEAGSDRVELLRKADIALYRAKAEGRNCYCRFIPAMDETVNLRKGIEDDLRAALATGEGLEVAYQPQVALGGGAIVGVEALARWQHPIRGCIQPSQFIPVAEQSGLINPLGDWVLRQACSASRRWPDLFVSVNLSPVQVRSKGFAERAVSIVRDSGGDPHRIEFEVTESVLLDMESGAVEALRALREAGFRIALDDFGTGYSSLGYLHRFEVDKIKIDRSFIQGLGQGAKAAAVIRAIVSLGHAMALTVTAEGVETEVQKSFLHTAGCNEMQGFLFSKALPAEQVTRLLKHSPPGRHCPLIGVPPLVPSN